MAHDCIMVRIKRTLPYTSLWHEDRPQWRAPLGSSTDRQAPSDAEAMQKAPVVVHHRSACSGVKALRNTSHARRQAAKLCYRFGPLTPSARSANLIAGDGTKNGFPAPNKEPAKTKNHHLTGKAPYKFESISLQRRVTCEPDFLDQIRKFVRRLLASFADGRPPLYPATEASGRSAPVVSRSPGQRVGKV